MLTALQTYLQFKIIWAVGKMQAILKIAECSKLHSIFSCNISGLE